MDASDAFEALLDRLIPRLDPLDAPRPSAGTIHAAVAVLLRPPQQAGAETSDGSAEALFIKRAERAGDPWSGHIAFPGGRPEAGEEDLAAVAVRETAEEVGIDLRLAGRLLGRLATVEPLSRRLPPIDVTPFVVRAPEGAVPRPDPNEVEDAFWLSLSALKAAGPSAIVQRVINGERRQWPAYPSPAGPIWGITQRILSGLLDLVG